MTLEIDIVTLFPAMLEGPLNGSIPGRIQEQGLATVRIRDMRDWGLGRHRSVDDAPYGGGAGMVLRPEPVAAALDELRRPDSTAILLDPAGEVFRQARAAELAVRSHLIFVCARYEGVDERIRSLVDLELSIGDYVLTGGELPALVVVDAVLRLLPGRHRRRVHDRGVVQCRASRVPPVHAPADVPGHGRAGDPDLGRPRRRRAVAGRAGPGADPRATTGSARRLNGRRTGADRPGARAILRHRSPPATTPNRPNRSFGCHSTKEPPRERARRDRQGPASNRPPRPRHG